MMSNMYTLLPYDPHRWLQKSQDIALPQVAWLAQGLKIFFDRLATQAPRFDMIDMQGKARLQRRACAASAA
jgi:hypothetical protein